MKKLSLLIIMIALLGLNEAIGQWTFNGVNIYNTNSGNVGIGNNSPSTLLYVTKNTTEPTITIRNLGGFGGATYSMIDDASGANWKFKATLSGGFKIRDHANELDVIVIEPNSAANLLYINSAGNVGINTVTPENSAIVDITSTDKGFLPPRMTQAERNNIASPATGLMIFQTDQTPGIYYYSGAIWTLVSISSNISGHYVGELFGGGVVFWINNTGEHGLICSMIDLSLNESWSNVYDEIGIPAQSDWNGQGNTNAIIGQVGHTQSAAKLCNDYVNTDYGTGVYSDWYLPSRGEINHIWNNLYEVQKALDSDGNNSTTLFAQYNYWTSTESGSFAWFFKFGDGYSYTAPKAASSNFQVRAIRAF